MVTSCCWYYCSRCSRHLVFSQLSSFLPLNVFYKVHEHSSKVREGPIELRALTGQFSVSNENEWMACCQCLYSWCAGDPLTQKCLGPPGKCIQGWTGNLAYWVKLYPHVLQWTGPIRFMPMRSNSTSVNANRYKVAFRVAHWLTSWTHITCIYLYIDLYICIFPLFNKLLTIAWS